MFALTAEDGAPPAMFPGRARRRVVLGARELVGELSSTSLDATRDSAGDGVRRVNCMVKGTVQGTRSSGLPPLGVAGPAHDVAIGRGFGGGGGATLVRANGGFRGGGSGHVTHSNGKGHPVGTNVSGDVVTIAVDVRGGIALAFEALALDKVGKSGYGLGNFERGNIWEQSVDRWVHFVAWIPEGTQAQVVKLFIEIDIDRKGGGRAIPAGVAAGKTEKVDTATGEVKTQDAAG